MSRLARWIIRLYPARWRARYGEELDALLADTGADARTVSDLFRGGIRMQMKTWHFLKLAFTLALAGLLLGTGVAWLIPAEYTSRATLQLQPTSIDPSAVGPILANSLNERILQLQTVVMSRTQLARIILHLDLYADERTKQPLDDAVEMLRQNTRIDLVALPGTLGKRVAAFDIRFNYRDRYKAQQTTNALMDAFAQAHMEQSRVHPASGPATLAIVDPPNLPEKPFSPQTSTLLLAACLSGAAIAGLWRLAHPVGIIRRRFAFTTLAMGISATVVMAAAINLPLWPAWYRSTGSLKLTGGSHEEIAAMTNDVLSRTSLSQIVNGPRFHLYENESRTTPLEDVIQSMKQHISIRQVAVPNGTLLEVSFEYYDRYKARQVTEALMNRFDAAGRRLHAVGTPAKPAETVLDTLDVANLPLTPTKPNRYLIAFAGALAGVFAAAIISLIRRRWKPEPDFPVTIASE